MRTPSLRLARREFKGSLRNTNAPLSDFHGLARRSESSLRRRSPGSATAAAPLKARPAMSDRLAGSGSTLGRASETSYLDVETHDPFQPSSPPTSPEFSSFRGFSDWVSLDWRSLQALRGGHNCGVPTARSARSETLLLELPFPGCFSAWPVAGDSRALLLALRPAGRAPGRQPLALCGGTTAQAATLTRC